MESGQRLSDHQAELVEDFVYRWVIMRGRNYTETAKALAQSELGIELSIQSIKIIADRRLSKIDLADPQGDLFIRRGVDRAEFAVTELYNEYERSKQPIETIEYRANVPGSPESLEDLTDDELDALARRGDKNCGSQVIKRKQGRIGDAQQLKVAHDYIILSGRLRGIETKQSKLRALEKAAEAVGKIAEIMGGDNKEFDLKGGEE